MTNEGLAKLIESVAVTLVGFQEQVVSFQEQVINFQEETRSAIRELRGDVQDLRGNVRELRGDVDELKEGAFTKDQKEDLMIMVKHINARLENEARGEKDITLTREEYDASSQARRFQNRFQKLQEISVD